ncbi:MAG: diguanylate cyclase [Deltaproteobacteria bacterium]|nr:diguanylate cyclase [Deltaproteobacteria bacterium]
MASTEADLRRWFIIIVSVVVLVLGVGGAVTYVLVGHLRGANQAVIYERAEELQDAEALGIAIYTRSASARGYLLSGDPAFLEERAAARAEIEVRLGRSRTRVRDVTASDLTAMEALLKRLDVTSDRAVAAVPSSRQTAQAIWVQEARPIQDQIESRMTKVLTAQRATFDAARQAASTASDTALSLLVLLLVVVLLLVTMLVYAYTRAMRSLLARQKAEQEATTFRLLEQVPVGIFVLTPDAKPYYANQHARKLLGRGLPQNASESLTVAYQAYEVGTDRIYPNDRTPLTRALAGELSEVTDMEIRTGDQVIPLHVVGAPVYNVRGELIYAVAGFQDVRELQRVAMRDALTGLVNRTAAAQAYTRERLASLRSKRPLAVGLIDLDRFKAINDTHGHASGDTVLRRTATALVESLRRTDIVGRWGGEELVVFMPGTDRDGARCALEKSLEAIRALEFTGKEGATFSVSFSAGVVVAEAEESLEAVVSRADKLLYEAKTAGRARVHGAAS